jgi:RimJ/RimL family protein N-acetyltransferase
MEFEFLNELKGQFVLLQKVTPDDAELIYHWRTGLSGKYLRQPEGYDLNMQRAWISSRNGSEINYIIRDVRTLEPVGMIGIYNLNGIDKVAEVGRLLLDESYLNKSTPYGLEALLLTYDFVFTVMKYRKISGVVAAKNSFMVKLQLFLGMTQEGYLKEHIWLSDGYEDVHVLSIFQKEFESVYKKKIRFLLKGFES